MSGEKKLTKRPMRIILPLMLWLGIILFARGFIPGLRGRAIRNDFAIYYVSALELREGINPYTTEFSSTAHHAGLEIKDVTKSTEPPFALLLFEPLTSFLPFTAYVIWQTINFFSLCAALIILLRGDSRFSRPALWTLAAIAFAYPPVISHFFYGQSKLPILLMLVIAMRFLSVAGSDRTAGLMLAFAGLMRIYPLVLGGYLVLEGRWRALGWMLAGVFAGVLATTALIGPINCISFFQGLSYLTEDKWTAMSGDNAPLAMLIRSLQALSITSTLSGSTQHLILILINVLLLSFTVRATLAHRLGEQQAVMPILSLWVTTAIVLPPVSWDYDMTLLLIPFACIALAASRGEASRRSIVMALLSYLLIAVWRFSGIRDSEQASSFAGYVLRETASLSLLCAYYASYWFVLDSAAEAIPLWQVPMVALTRMFGSTSPKLKASSIEVAG